MQFIIVEALMKGNTFHPREALAYPFLVEARTHVVNGRLEARVEDGVVEGVCRGGEEGAEEAEGVPHPDIAVRQFTAIFAAFEQYCYGINCESYLLLLPNGRIVLLKQPQNLKEVRAFMLRIPPSHSPIALWQRLAVEVVDESVDDHGRPADEESDGDGGHEQVHAPAPLLHRLVRARRPEDANREK